MRVTIKDIAKEVGVSITTVSRVLNNKPDVSDKTRKEIQQVINRMSYNPNKIARGLVLQKTNIIGLIIPNISNPFFPALLKGAENKARELGYSIIFYNTDDYIERELEALDLMDSKQVDGVIVSFTKNNINKLNELIDSGFAIVAIDRILPNLKCSSVIIDNVLSAYKAVSHLIKLGHNKIGHIAGILNIKNSQDRLKGFKKALKEAGLNYNKKWVREGDHSKESGYKQMKEILKNSNVPTAIFVANDLMAVGAYEAVFDFGLKVPEDISIIGHDDISISPFLRPKLTTIKQPKYDMGKVAVEKLIAKIEGEVNNKEDTILETELIIRESTKKFKSI